MGHRIQGGGIAGGVGVREEQLRLGSGLRLSCLTTIARDQIDVVSGTAAPIGTADGTQPTPVEPADVWFDPAWSAFSGRMPFPMTPMIAITSTAPSASKRVRIRMSGLDQFWSPQLEITPFVALDATLDVMQFPMSKVFAFVAKVEYQFELLDSDTDTISVGISNVFDPTEVADVAQDADNARVLKNLENLGFATPIRISPFGVSQPVSHPEVIGDVTAWNMTSDTFAHIQPLGVVAGFTVGVSAAGFQGYAHKLGFDSPDGWTTKILDLAGAEFRMGGEAEGVASSPVRASDTTKYMAQFRSSVGTRREAMAESIYPRIGGVTTVQ